MSRTRCATSAIIVALRGKPTMSATDYETERGNDVPEQVAETFDEPEEWDGHLSPTDVPVHGSLIGDIYEGMVDGKRQWVTDSGRASRNYQYVTQVPKGQYPTAGNAVSYREDVNVVHRDHYYEHVTRVIVVLDRGTRLTFGSGSGIVWYEHHRSDVDAHDAPDSALELVTALVDAETDVSLPEDYESALSGWHSSMERSEQSDMMNALSAGDVPPHWREESTEDIYPYVVRYGDTRNVCSVNASVYGKETFRELVREEFSDASAAPAYGGFE